MIKVKDLGKYEERETYYYFDVKQKGKKWCEIRRGRITASIISKLMDGEPFQLHTKEGYKETAQKIKGEIIEEHDNATLFRMNKGNEWEPKARKYAEKWLSKNKKQKIKIYEPGIGVWKKDERFAASPDGLFEYDGKRCGLEIKCPQFMYNKTIQSHIDQIIMCAIIFDLDEYYYCVCPWDSDDFTVEKIKIDKERWKLLYKNACSFYSTYISN